MEDLKGSTSLFTHVAITNSGSVSLKASELTGNYGGDNKSVK